MKQMFPLKLNLMKSVDCSECDERWRRWSIGGRHKGLNRHIMVGGEETTFTSFQCKPDMSSDSLTRRQKPGII